MELSVYLMMGNNNNFWVYGFKRRTSIQNKHPKSVENGEQPFSGGILMVDHLVKGETITDANLLSKVLQRWSKKINYLKAWFTSTSTLFTRPGSVGLVPLVPQTRNLPRSTRKRDT